MPAYRETGAPKGPPFFQERVIFNPSLIYLHFNTFFGIG